MKWIDLENYKFPEGITLNRNTVNNSLTFKMVDTSLQGLVSFLKLENYVFL